jgi:hypothetical protein
MWAVITTKNMHISDMQERDRGEPVWGISVTGDECRHALVY